MPTAPKINVPKNARTWEAQKFVLKDLFKGLRRRGYIAKMNASEKFMPGEDFVIADNHRVRQFEKTSKLYLDWQGDIGEILSEMKMRNIKVIANKKGDPGLAIGIDLLVPAKELK